MRGCETWKSPKFDSWVSGACADLLEKGFKKKMSRGVRCEEFVGRAACQFARASEAGKWWLEGLGESESCISARVNILTDSLIILEAAAKPEMRH
jgi:hypothetical protein